MPVPGSRFCVRCRPFAARRTDQTAELEPGNQSTVTASTKDSRVCEPCDDEAICEPCAEESAAVPPGHVFDFRMLYTLPHVEAIESSIPDAGAGLGTKKAFSEGEDGAPPAPDRGTRADRESDACTDALAGVALGGGDRARCGDGEGELDELDEGRPCGTRDWHRLHAGVSSQAEVVVCRLLSDVGDG
ncbi:hypothetical protein EMIHUDRAFT_194640 [Emiliania huxleyi CCMP1516]|uniref:ZZ-type domain-containing protein n=2 Tax=Emiliania huxleyi TaxID=2903 RepID=A0A0D3L1V2_EMIH1|nr:hypothetical protein EMIHUDRAFT_194640 [Emiliania huxleyi CCMP1516]EOD41987.1 hypothetical protein EMIHUDRAFT_194640 [Emiliania huxleyi CCMP1516]|eukprot:XP_005794416.1 hypothetical protein EMIHUDRAFT_194640 [Emiliania huxleyi CCMP1516]